MHVRYQDALPDGRPTWRTGDDQGIAMAAVQFDVETIEGQLLLVGRLPYRGEVLSIATAVMPNPMTGKVRLFEALRVEVARRNPVT